MNTLLVEVGKVSPGIVSKAKEAPYDGHARSLLVKATFLLEGNVASCLPDDYACLVFE